MTCRETSGNGCRIITPARITASVPLPIPRDRNPVLLAAPVLSAPPSVAPDVAGPVGLVDVAAQVVVKVAISSLRHHLFELRSPPEARNKSKSTHCGGKWKNSSRNCKSFAVILRTVLPAADGAGLLLPAARAAL